MTDAILTRVQDGVLRVQFNRPEKKNAITIEMYDAIADAITNADARDEVGAILLEGGDDVFTSGNDLSAFVNVTSALAEGSEPAVLKMIKATVLSNTPLVAAVSGPCIGIGATILLHFDLVYADETAYLHMPFTELAAVPEACASWVIRRRYGSAIAGELLVASEKVSAKRAYDMGLINKVVDANVKQHAFEAARHIASLPPVSVRETKKLMREDMGPFLAHAEAELREFAERLQSQEMQETVMKKMAAGKA
ncbi:MAG: enoyl-CoA hydratase-related protein [Pseudomonadota bacterium]